MAPEFPERAGLALSVGTSNSDTLCEFEFAVVGSFEFGVVGHPGTHPL